MWDGVGGAMNSAFVATVPSADRSTITLVSMRQGQMNAGEVLALGMVGSARERGGKICSPIGLGGSSAESC
jgi:hypothetical protein